MKLKQEEKYYEVEKQLLEHITVSQIKYVYFQLQLYKLYIL